MIASPNTKLPSLKEVEKFFRYAKNSLVSSVALGEVKSWIQVDEWLAKNWKHKSAAPEISSNDGSGFIPISDNYPEFNAKNVAKQLEITREECVRDIQKKLYAQTILSTNTSTERKEIEEIKEGQKEEEDVGNDSRIQLESKSVSIEQNHTPIVIDRTQQRKINRRYENWYSRIPPEKLAENGGTIPQLNTEKQVAELLYYQVDAAVGLFESFVIHSRRGELLRAGVGVGKTYIFGQLLRWLYDVNFHVGPVHSLFPYIVVTKASIVTQTERVLRDKFGLPVSNFGGGVMVTNYDQLRANLGNIMIDWHTQVINGEEVLFPVWKEVIHPAVIIWDECQGLKNEGSTQTQIARAYSRIPDKKIPKEQANDNTFNQHPTWKDEANRTVLSGGDVLVPNTWQLFSSATPFTTVNEAKTFALATRARVGAENMRGYKGD